MARLVKTSKEGSRIYQLDRWGGPKRGVEGDSCTVTRVGTTWGSIFGVVKSTIVDDGGSRYSGWVRKAE
eukprot:766552-Hanusia_phi.AAC.1